MYPGIWADAQDRIADSHLNSVAGVLPPLPAMFLPYSGKAIMPGPEAALSLVPASSPFQGSLELTSTEECQAEAARHLAQVLPKCATV